MKLYITRCVLFSHNIFSFFNFSSALEKCQQYFGFSQVFIQVPAFQALLAT